MKLIEIPMECPKIEWVCRLIRTRGKTERGETEAGEMRTPGPKNKRGRELDEEVRKEGRLSLIHI